MSTAPLPVPPPATAPPKKSGGWKSKFGAILKGIGGVVLGYFLEQILPGLIANGAGQGVGMALGGVIAADALQQYGQAHKLERSIEATEANTAAVLRDTTISNR